MAYTKQKPVTMAAPQNAKAAKKKRRLLVERRLACEEACRMFAIWKSVQLKRDVSPSWCLHKASCMAPPRFGRLNMLPEFVH